MTADAAVWSPRRLLVLAALTLVWGLNWPVMKAGVSGLPGEGAGGFAPLSFRVLSMWLGLPLLWLAVRATATPLRVARADWPELAKLTLTNMVVWHVLAIVAIQALSSGRAAILGYTMPVFSALWGMALFGQRLAPRQALGVAAAAAGVALLLWHELGHLAGRPWAAAAMLTAAATWALGTQQLRRTTVATPMLAIVFWMTLATTLVMSLAAVVFERGLWRLPGAVTWGAIVFNAVLIFGFAQPAWLFLARLLPPAASTLSVMLIPVLGVASGAWLLGERLFWQDFAAMLLMLLAIGSVLWPAAAPAPSAQPPRA